MQDQEEIIKAMADHLGLTPQDIDHHASLRDELNLGSLELNDLLSHLSQKFDVVFDSEDVSNLNTVDDLIVLIEDNMI
jgi:acyl carrier protein